MGCSAYLVFPDAFTLAARKPLCALFDIVAILGELTVANWIAHAEELEGSGGWAGRGGGSFADVFAAVEDAVAVEHLSALLPL